MKTQRVMIGLICLILLLVGGIILPCENRGMIMA